MRYTPKHISRSLCIWCLGALSPLVAASLFSSFSFCASSSAVYLNCGWWPTWRVNSSNLFFVNSDPDFSFLPVRIRANCRFLAVSGVIDSAHTCVSSMRSDSRWFDEFQRPVNVITREHVTLFSSTSTYSLFCIFSCFSTHCERFVLPLSARIL